MDFLLFGSNYQLLYQALFGFCCIAEFVFCGLVPAECHEVIHGLTLILFTLLELVTGQPVIHFRFQVFFAFLPYFLWFAFVAFLAPRPTLVYVYAKATDP